MQTLFTRHQPGRKTLPIEVKVNTLPTFPGPRFIVMVMTVLRISAGATVFGICRKTPAR